MLRVRHCSQCRTMFIAACPNCGQPGTFVPDVHLAEPMDIDVTITLRVDCLNRPFILIQKPSGQDSIALNHRDLHTTLDTRL